MIGKAIGKPRPLVTVPRTLALGFLGALGLFVKDVVLTREEIDALMDDLLVTDSPSTGKTLFSVWLAEHSHELGQRYASELARRRNRQAAYARL